LITTGMVKDSGPLIDPGFKIPTYSSLRTEKGKEALPAMILTTD
jgi:hypothetical protein